ncbi:hypothetical protein [Rhodanobacter caeni]|uniref:hypothetical protein n=1 Tax=Rhodanobacter caeni TaxID=657654 RepID=UPI0031CE205F
MSRLSLQRARLASAFCGNSHMNGTPPNGRRNTDGGPKKFSLPGFERDESAMKRLARRVEGGGRRAFASRVARIPIDRRRRRRIKKTAA